jgi:hypothetical protein
MRGRLEEHLDHLNIREEAGGIVWVNPSSKCASCHSNEMHQRIIHTHVNVSSKAYVYDDTIYNFCARARFAGCTYLRNIILALNTVYWPARLAGIRFRAPQKIYKYGLSSSCCLTVFFKRPLPHLRILKKKDYKKCIFDCA